MDELEPSHIKLRSSRATPLSCLEENESDRLVGSTHLFEGCYELTLRTGKSEKDFPLARYLGLDMYESCGPEREIVTAPQSDELVDDLDAILRSIFDTEHTGDKLSDRTGLGKHSDHGNISHGNREELRANREIRDLKQKPLPHRTTTGDWIEWSVDCGQTAVILMENIY